MSDKYRALVGLEIIGFRSAVLVGLDYPPGKRAEAGAVVADLPDKSIKWLLKQQLIEPIGAAPKEAEAK